MSLHSTPPSTLPPSTLKAAVIPVTPFQQNCSLLWCAENMRGAVVDPGGDLDRILEQRATLGIKVERILITHGHLDHSGAAGELAAQLEVPIEGPHRSDLFLVETLAEQGRLFGLPGSASFQPDRWLENGDQVQVGGLELDVYHCPGHTPGHIVFHHPASQLAVVGDVLFRGSVGRTDLPRGDWNALLNSIRERLWPLGDDTTFIPGHGPLSTFGQERLDNPFVADSQLQQHRE